MNVIRFIIPPAIKPIITFEFKKEKEMNKNLFIYLLKKLNYCNSEFFIKRKNATF